MTIPNEAAPPGGVVQMKVLVTEPTPITSGGPRLAFDAKMFDAVFGIELFNPVGDVNGVAMINGPQVQVRYTTSSGGPGTDYPIMSIALHIRPDAPVGSQTQFNLDPSSTWILGLLGGATLKPMLPATVTVGGSISITNIVPGGGVLPAGSVVSIQGIGFQPKTQVQLNQIKASSIVVVSANEIQFTLAETTSMTGQKIQVLNPDGSQDIYFSYMRGIPLGQSNQALLGLAVPIFSSVTHSQALFAPMTPALNNQFTGLAIQNPNQSDTSATINLYSASNGLLGSASFVIPSGYRLMREISELAGGATAGPGSYAVITSTQPVQAFGFTADYASGTLIPFAALSWQP
ncbi:MAG TPA: IPT/TIG domain-containing protein [Candidatus Acidoferrales bacterium]|nr:IPT/TIG domain-containing protein [Candidatus Acidoferrales bacterium]